MDTLLADVRQALRGLRRSPGFAFAAIGILAIGLAANTAVFSVADAILFRPLAYSQPEQLVNINEVVPQYSHLYPKLPVNAKHYYEWVARMRSFSRLSILQEGALNLTGPDGPPERLGTEYVSANLLPLFGVHTLLGRNFTDQEDRPGNDRVVILTEALWQRRFHGDPALLNKTILLNGTPHLVVGILPASFVFPRADLITAIGGSTLKIELLKPIALDRSKVEDIGFNYTVLGRLRPGVALKQASAEMNAVQVALSKEFGKMALEFRAVLTPLQEQMVAGSQRGLLLLLGSIAVVLLIVCVNLGNLMLARATARSREMAVRAALGAGSWRIVRQVLTESLVIAFAGGAMGIALAYAGVRALVASAPVDLPRLDEVHLDFRALLFALAASVFAGLLFGVIPAWRAARSAPQDALRSGGRTVTGDRRAVKLADILVSAEVALSAALLVSAGLLIGSFIRILGVDQGFQAQNILTATLNLAGVKYQDGKQRSEFYDRLLPAMKSLPGVQAVGMISALPLQGETWVDMITRDDDHRPMFQRPVANYRFISPEYFSAMGIPIRTGRSFEFGDRARQVSIVSASTASRIWPGVSAIGKHARRSDDKGPLTEVVGVVADTRTSMKGDQPMMVYLPYWREPGRSFSLAIRTSQDAASAASAVRNAIWSLDSELPVPEMKTIRQVIADAVAQRRFQTSLLAGFALAALLLAIIGIYGVISYSVNRRRNEIGVRMALGAKASDVIRMMVGQGMRPVAIGLVVGLGAALVSGRLLESLLFGIRASNPLVMTAVILVLTLASAAACYLPVRRATTSDPSKVLRYE